MYSITLRLNLFLIELDCQTDLFRQPANSNDIGTNISQPECNPAFQIPANNHIGEAEVGSGSIPPSYTPRY